MSNIVWRLRLRVARLVVSLCFRWLVAALFLAVSLWRSMLFLLVSNLFFRLTRF